MHLYQINYQPNNFTNKSVSFSGLPSGKGQRIIRSGAPVLTAFAMTQFTKSSGIPKDFDDMRSRVTIKRSESQNPLIINLENMLQVDEESIVEAKYIVRPSEEVIEKRRSIQRRFDNRSWFHRLTNMKEDHNEYEYESKRNRAIFGDTYQIDEKGVRNITGVPYTTLEPEVKIEEDFSRSEWGCRYDAYNYHYNDGSHKYMRESCFNTWVSKITDEHDNVQKYEVSYNHDDYRLTILPQGIIQGYSFKFAEIDGKLYCTSSERFKPPKNAQIYTFRNNDVSSHDKGEDIKCDENGNITIKLDGKLHGQKKSFICYMDNKCNISIQELKDEK